MISNAFSMLLNLWLTGKLVELNDEVINLKKEKLKENGISI